MSQLKVDQICALMMRRSAEALAQGDQEAMQGFRRDRLDQEADLLAHGAVLLMENEVRIAQASDTIMRLAIIAGLENDPETRRILAYLDEARPVQPGFRRFSPRRLPLAYRIRRNTIAFALAASAVMASYG